VSPCLPRCASGLRCSGRQRSRPAAGGGASAGSQTLRTGGVGDARSGSRASRSVSRLHPHLVHTFIQISPILACTRIASPAAPTLRESWRPQPRRPRDRRTDRFPGGRRAGACGQRRYLRHGRLGACAQLCTGAGEDGGRDGASGSAGEHDRTVRVGLRRPRRSRPVPGLRPRASRGAVHGDGPLRSRDTCHRRACPLPR